MMEGSEDWVVSRSGGGDYGDGNGDCARGYDRIVSMVMSVGVPACCGHHFCLLS